MMVGMLPMLQRVEVIDWLTCLKVVSAKTVQQFFSAYS